MYNEPTVFMVNFETAIIIIFRKFRECTTGNLIGNSFIT